MFDRDCRGELLSRLRRLTPDRPVQWGRMTAPQMLAHLGDQMRNTLGECPCAPMPSPLRRPVIRELALYWLPWPKARVEGPPHGPRRRIAGFVDAQHLAREHPRVLWRDADRRIAGADPEVTVGPETQAAAGVLAELAGRVDLRAGEDVGAVRHGGGRGVERQARDAHVHAGRGRRVADEDLVGGGVGGVDGQAHHPGLDRDEEIGGSPQQSSLTVHDRAEPEGALGEHHGLVGEKADVPRDVQPALHRGHPHGRRGDTRGEQGGGDERAHQPHRA